MPSKTDLPLASYSLAASTILRPLVVFTSRKRLPEVELRTPTAPYNHPSSFCRDLDTLTSLNMSSIFGCTLVPAVAP